MTTPTVESQAPGISPVSLRALAVHGPLLLFASGILRWVDQFDQRPGSGAPWLVAQGLLCAAAVAFVGVAWVLRNDWRRLHLSSWLLVIAGSLTAPLAPGLLPLAALLLLIGLAPLCVIEASEASDAGIAPIPPGPPG